jgi:hypothetical protein
MVNARDAMEKNAHVVMKKWSSGSESEGKGIKDHTTAEKWPCEGEDAGARVKNEGEGLHPTLAMSLSDRRHVRMSKLDAMRLGVSDLGITQQPRCTPHL